MGGPSSSLRISSNLVESWLEQAGPSDQKRLYSLRLAALKNSMFYSSGSQHITKGQIGRFEGLYNLF